MLSVCGAGIIAFLIITEAHPSNARNFTLFFGIPNGATCDLNTTGEELYTGAEPIDVTPSKYVSVYHISNTVLNTTIISFESGNSLLWHIIRRYIGITSDNCCATIIYIFPRWLFLDKYAPYLFQDSSSFARVGDFNRNFYFPGIFCDNKWNVWATVQSRSLNFAQQPLVASQSGPPNKYKAVGKKYQLQVGYFDFFTNPPRKPTIAGSIVGVIFLGVGIIILSSRSDLLSLIGWVLFALGWSMALYGPGILQVI